MNSKETGWIEIGGKQIKALRTPTLLLWGMQDVMIHLNQMQTLQAALGAVSQLSILAGSGHMSPVEVPDQFNQVMEAYVEPYVSSEQGAADPL
jgi:pimeloyl-ACP methyl ester carboxylesterase